MVATHDMEQTRAWDRVLCLNVRQVAFGPPEVVLTREVLEAHVRRRRSSCCRPRPGVRGRSAARAPSRAPRTDDAARRRRRRRSCSTRGAAASRSRALARDPAARLRRRAARVLGRAVRPVVRSRVARARHASRARDRGAGRVPAHARRRARSRARRAGDRAGRRGSRRSAPTPRSRWWSRRWSELGALLALAPDSPAGVQRAAVRRRARRLERRAAADRAHWRCVVLAALRLAHGQLLTVGFDRSERARLRRQPARGGHAAAVARRRVHDRRGAGARDPAGARDAGRAGSDRAARSRTGCAAMMALAAADRRRRRRRRAVPLLLRGHRGRRVDRRGGGRRPHRRGGRSQALEDRLKAGPVTGLEPAS